MTQQLANDLMDCLCALAISANGRIPETQEDMAMCQEYAQGTFLSLCEDWEKTMGRLGKSPHEAPTFELR